MSQAFQAFLLNCRQRVDATLECLLPKAADSAPQAHKLEQAMRYSVFNGGKRVRPVLVYASAVAVSESNEAGETAPEGLTTDIDKIACALECIHAYSLVHDDLPAMDNDDLRRGKPTCHIAFDEATAILAGDALQTLAFEQLTGLQNVSARTSLALIRELARAAGATGMVAGQAIDLAAVNRALTTRDLETMHNHKTGALIRASVAMGAQAAGANTAQLRALDHYACAIGLAFQVQDDILDITADTTTLGKRQGADKALNKPTYVSLLGLEQARHKALTLHREALQALSDFSVNADFLRQLSRFIVERKH